MGHALIMSDESGKIRDEDIQGLPFVGRSGKLLDLMLAAIGLDRSSVYIANIIPWRPPGNRTPTPQESQICLPFIRRQIELAAPDVLVFLGGPSAQTLLGVKEGITRIRGRWFSYQTGTREIRAMPTFHPAFLLRSPLQKRLDLSFGKNTKINERMSFELGFDIFNVFNTVNLANPNSDLQDSTDFGTIRSLATPPRQIQLGVKVYF